MSVRQLSYSSVSAYLGCPFRWRKRYVERAPAPATEPLIVGSAVHGAVEGYLKRRFLGQEADLATLWRKAFWAQARGRAARDGVDWGQGTGEDAYWRGQRLLIETADLTVEHHLLGADGRDLTTAHTSSSIPAFLDGIELLGARGKPAIEKRVSMRVPGVDVPVVGFVDWLEADGVPADLKTSGQPWQAEEAALALQPAFYLASLEQMGYEHNPRRVFRHYILVRGEAPRLQIFETRRNKPQLEWVHALIRQVWRALEAGHFFPNPTNRWCTPSHCEYWASCRGWGGDRG